MIRPLPKLPEPKWKVNRVQPPSSVHTLPESMDFIRGKGTRMQMLTLMWYKSLGGDQYINKHSMLRGTLDQVTLMVVVMN